MKTLLYSVHTEIFIVKSMYIMHERCWYIVYVNNEKIEITSLVSLMQTIG